MKALAILIAISLKQKKEKINVQFKIPRLIETTNESRENSRSRFEQRFARRKYEFYVELLAIVLKLKQFINGKFNIPVNKQDLLHYPPKEDDNI